MTSHYTKLYRKAFAKFDVVSVRHDARSYPISNQYFGALTQSTIIYRIPHFIAFIFPCTAYYHYYYMLFHSQCFCNIYLKLHKSVVIPLIHYHMAIVDCISSNLFTILTSSFLAHSFTCKDVTIIIQT